MRPNFALSLSLDGISLLHRAAGGWRRVGSIALDAADLAGELAALRERAEALEPAGLRCKVLIPNDQIRYMTIETGRVSEDARRAAAAQALDGATPYALDELAFDVSADGEATHVAAVARETLDEAESFAVEHGFNPVSFAAVPEDGTFPGEPFFGRSAFADSLPDSADIARDEFAVVIIGDIEPGPSPDASAPDAAPDTSAPDAARAEGPSFASIRARSDTPAQPAAAASPGVEPRLTIRLAAEAEERPGPAAAEPDPAPPEANAGTAPDPARPDRPGTARLTVPAAPASPRIDDLPPDDESARLTLFGKRQVPQARSGRRHLGLVLSVALLLVLAAIAVWAMLSLDDGIAGLFRGSDRATATATAPPAAPPAALPGPPGDVHPRDAHPAPAPAAATAPPAPSPAPSPPVAPVLPDVAALPAPRAAPMTPSPEADMPIDPVMTETDAAVLDALRTPAEAPPQADQADVADDTSAARTQALYAASGIWHTAPAVPETPSIISLGDIYIASIDRTDLFSDIVTLPEPDALQTDISPAVLASPAAAGTRFALDDQGLVKPTPEGALTPDGIRIHRGKPPVLPPAVPDRRDARQEQEAQTRNARLAAIRPRPRPGDLTEARERALLGGRTRAELGRLRPKMRPALTGPLTAPAAPPTAQAVAAAARPRLRPGNFSAAVKRALASARASGAGQPHLPSAASVTRQATVKNAIRLRAVSLIGVYGTASNRRALVRLSSGRYRKVKVGDRLDGGRIIAIGEAELRYQKNGRNVVLKMPRG